MRSVTGEGSGWPFAVLAAAHLAGCLYYFPPREIFSGEPLLTGDYVLHFHEAVRAKSYLWHGSFLGYCTTWMAGFPDGFVGMIKNKPFVLAVGWYFTRSASAYGRAKVPVPVFALVFLALCLVNSVASELPGIAPFYQPAKSLLNVASTWGLLIAIGALGLDTAPSAIAALGWRHVATISGTTVVVLAAVLLGLLALG